MEYEAIYGNQETLGYREINEYGEKWKNFQLIFQNWAIYTSMHNLHLLVFNCTKVQVKAG